MKRRALLGTISAAIPGVAGCLGGHTSSETGGWDEYTWKHEIPGWGMTVSNGRVFGREKFPSSEPEERFETEIAGGIFALDGETGDHQWTYGSTYPAYDSYTALTVKDAIYATKTDDAGHSRTAAVEFDGTERWSAVDGELQHVIDGIAYVKEDGGDPTIRAIDIDSGDELWTHPGTSVQFDTAVGDAPETAYVAGAELVALDTDDWSVQWRYEHGDDHSRVEAVSDGVVYTSNDFESIVAVADAEERWRTGSVSYPVIHDVTAALVLVQADSRVFAFDVTTGDKRWVKEADSLRVHDDSVYVGGRGVSALELDGGSEVWSADVGDETVESMKVVTEERTATEPSLFVQTEGNFTA